MRWNAWETGERWERSCSWSQSYTVQGSFGTDSCRVRGWGGWSTERTSQDGLPGSKKKKKRRSTTRIQDARTPMRSIAMSGSHLFLFVR